MAVATTALAVVAHLDGAGATTFLIAVPAMLPIYERLGMSRLVLATCVGLGAGVMNMVPWGGPTARAAATLGVDANELWVPLIPAQIAGVAYALGAAYYLGRRERTRLAKVAAGDASAVVEESTARVAEPCPWDPGIPDPQSVTRTRSPAARRPVATMRTDRQPRRVTEHCCGRSCSGSTPSW
ncbi:SLC13 family permease [Rhodococcus sp. (in: high G+C Gram-positive bacteria)]|uniref:SLC13 family permease n=1 Tax=Rhodococcus sp. TaxID=1831 RepID=UPI003260047F